MATAPGIPVSLQPLLSSAQTSAARGDLVGAIAIYEKILAHLPNDPYTLVQLSYMHSLRGSYRRAREFALAAADTGTTNPDVLIELLPRLRTFNEVATMLACIERALPMARMSIPLLIAVAAQLTYVNLPERAIAFLDEARRADPDYPATLLARTQVLTYLGRFDDAGQDAKRALRRAPEIAQGYWLQAGLRRQTEDSNHVRWIRRELARPARSADDVAVLSFALHKELDDLGMYDEAWSALVQGCSAKRSRLNYDSSRMHELYAALAAFEPTRAMPSQTAPAADASTPIFIVGMHRSGTTLLEQMLAGHPQVAALGELYDFTSSMRFGTDHHCKGVIDATIVQRARSIDLAEAGLRYLDSVAWRLGEKKFFTDKLPSNFLNLGFIAHGLPSARIVHMVRDPIETCFSNLRELFSDANAYSYDMDELADYYLHYEALMGHWHARLPRRILNVEYSRLLSEPEEQLRRVADFVGLPFDPAMLAHDARRRGVVTASAVQVRAGIQTLARPKWLPYEGWLKPMITRLRAGL